jgi:hypothetical protein
MMTIWKDKNPTRTRDQLLEDYEGKLEAEERWSGCWFDGDVMRGADCNKINWWAQAQKQSDESDVYVTDCFFDTCE